MTSFDSHLPMTRSFARFTAGPALAAVALALAFLVGKEVLWPLMSPDMRRRSALLSVLGTSFAAVVVMTIVARFLEL
jgi:hypothetical protein